jgi:hypothetical protein
MTLFVTQGDVVFSFQPDLRGKFLTVRAWIVVYSIMKTIEFETELRGNAVLPIPREIAADFPRKGKATVLVCINMDPEDEAWRKAAYKHFFRDDSVEDAIYDKYC